MSVRTLISAVLPDTTGKSGGILQVADSSGNLAWVTSPTVTTITANSGTFGQVYVGPSSDIPASFGGMWIGATQIATPTTALYSLLGKYDGSETDVNVPSSTGLVNLKAANTTLAFLKGGNTPALNIQGYATLGQAVDPTYGGLYLGTTPVTNSTGNPGYLWYTLLGSNDGNTLIIQAPGPTPSILFRGNANNGNYVTITPTSFQLQPALKLNMGQTGVTGGTSVTCNFPSGIITFNTNITTVTVTCSFCDSTSCVLVSSSLGVAWAVAPSNGSFVAVPSATVTSGNKLYFVIIN